jgi:hypothetical protein
MRLELELFAMSMLIVTIGCGGSNSGTTGSATNNGVSVTVSANPTNVTLGETTRVTWSSVNATSCLATSAPEESDFTALLGTSGSAAVTPAVFGGETYSVTCTGATGSATTASTSVTVNSAASGLINGPIAPPLTVPASYWLGSGCVLDGQTINSLTILGDTGQNTGLLFDGILTLGVSSGQAGGLPASWTATGDGHGMLLSYSTSRCPGTPPSTVILPLSLTSISGSAATGNFSAQLIDQKGVIASCSFTLAKPQNVGQVCF